jgi:serine/threonine-protein kinase
MVQQTSDQFRSLLRQTQILSATQLAHLDTLAEMIGDEPHQLVFAAVKLGWLTSYQAEQLLEGHGANLVLGGCVLLEPIGEGGMGQVFRAWQQRLNRVVALKLVRPELVRMNSEVARRFQREALAVAQLSHPNIVVIYDAGQEGNTPYLIMEHVEGPDLSKLVRDAGPLPVPLACDFIRQAALGLQHAHRLGMVHRDIKPSNLLITSMEFGPATPDSAAPHVLARGLVKILDLGLARIRREKDAETTLTQSGMMMGTPDYMAPEQARNARDVDIRADLYSLGCTLYFLLAGRPPFAGGTTVEKIMHHQNNYPVAISQLRPDVDATLQAIIIKLMAKRKEDRFQTPAELADVLAGYLGLAPAVAFEWPRPITAADTNDDRSEDSIFEMERHLQPIAEPNPASVSALSFVDSAPPKPLPSLSPRQLRPAPKSERPPAAEPPVAELPPAPQPAAWVSPPPKPALPDPDEGVTVVNASMVVAKNDKIDLFANAIPARKTILLRGHNGPVMSLAFSADDRLLATGGIDQSVRLWEIHEAAAREVDLFREKSLGEVQALAFHPHREYVVTGSGSLSSKMWCWQWSHKLGGADRQAVADVSGYSTALSFSRDGQWLLSAFGNDVVVLNTADGIPQRLTSFTGPGGEIRSLGFGVEDKSIGCGDDTGSIGIWKLGKYSSRPVVRFQQQGGTVFSLAFSECGRYLATAGTDQTIWIWDSTKSVATKLKTLPMDAGTIKRLLFLPDPTYLLAVADRGLAVLWQWTTSTPCLVWKFGGSLICSLAVAGHGGTLAVGASDGSVSLFDLSPDTVAD